LKTLVAEHRRKSPRQDCRFTLGTTDFTPGRGATSARGQALSFGGGRAAERGGATPQPGRRSRRNSGSAARPQHGAGTDAFARCSPWRLIGQGYCLCTASPEKN